MANEFDNVETKIGQLGEARSSNDGLVAEAYAGMGALKALNTGRSSAGIDEAFGQLTLTGSDQQGHPGTTRAPRPMPSPLDVSPEAEARRRAEAARRLYEQWQRQPGPVFPH